MRARATLVVGLAVVGAVLAGGAARHPAAQPGFLVDALGSRDGRTATSRVELSGDGYTVRDGRHSISLASAAGGGDWQRFANGYGRSTSFGSEAITVEPDRTENFLTVMRHTGARTWRWRLDARGLVPSLTSDGSVSLDSKDGNRHFTIPAVQILDAKGGGITPLGSRWHLARRDGSLLLELALDDSRLPLPYVIDPAIIRRNATSLQAAASTSVVINKPSAVVSGDVMLAQITAKASSGVIPTITPPSGWTLVRNDANGTAMEQAIYWKAAGSSEPASYTWTLSLSVTASGGIVGYSGVDTSSPIDTSGVTVSAANGTALSAPSVTTTQDSDIVAFLFGSNAKTTIAQAAGTWIEYDAGIGFTGSGTDSAASDTTQAVAGASIGETATAANSAAWIGTTIALKRSATAPSNIVYGDRTFKAQAAALSMALNKPTTVNVNDLLLAQVTVEGGTGTTITPPSGWTLVRRDDSSTNTAQAIYYHTVVSGDPASWTWTFSQSKAASGGIVAYTGVDNSDPIDASSGGVSASNGAAVQAPSVTTTNANDVVAGFFGTSAAAIFVQPSGTTERWDAYAGTGSSGSELADFLQATAGATGAYTATADSNGAWVGQLVALNLDTTVPAQTLSVTEGTSPSLQHFNSSSNTLYYNPTATGTFTVTSNSTDGGAGMKSVVFPAVSATGLTESASEDSASPYTSGSYTFTTANTTAPSAQAIVAEDSATNQTTTNLNFVRDVTAPASVSVALSGGPYYTTASVPLTLNNGSDSESGLDTSTTVVERETATLSNGTCNFTAGWSTVTLSGGADTGVADGHCYHYRYKISDNVGNQTISATSADAIVDTTKPVYASSATNTVGTQITLTLTEAGSGLNTNETTPGSAFTVLVNGGSRSVSSVSTSDSTHIVLTLASRVYGEDSVTVAYSTSGLTGLQPVQDLAGNTLNTFTAQTVTNTATADTTKSTLVAGTTTIYADSSGGATSSTITVTLKKSDNTNLGTSGGTVAMSTDLGSLSSVTNVGNGTYTATLTSTVTGTAHLTGTLDGRSFSATANVTVNPGLLDHFAVTNTSGGSIGTQNAGSAFNVKITAQDVNNNTVTSFTGAGNTVAVSSNRVCSSGCTTSSTFTNGVLSSHSVTLTQAGASSTVTATRSSGGSQAGTSNTFTVNAGSFTKLQLLLPGETAAPGSGTGKTGSPTAQTAGSSFTVTVNAVDANWNAVSSTDTVHLTSSDGYATLPADTALVAGTKQLSVTLKTAASQTLTASDQSNGGITSNTSASVTVNAGTVTKLQLLLPGETADPGSSTGKTGTPTARTAGTAFNVTVNAVDANWNLVTTTDTVRLTSTDGYATLPADTALVAGTKQLSVTLKTAASQTLTASDQTNGAITSNTSPSVTVNAGSLTKLQILLPGETADPGSSTGKTGTPTARTAGSAFNVTVNAVDANWNLINSVTDTVRLTSTDTHASLPADTALVAGTKQLSVTAKTAGSWTITSSDQTNGAITSNTSPSVTVNAGSLTKLQILLPGETADPGSSTGKTGTPTARTAGSAFNVTVNAVDANWNLINSVTDTVRLTSTDTHASLPADTALVAGTKQLSVTAKTAGSWTITSSDQTNGAITSNTSPSVTVNAGSLTKLQILLPGETADPGSSTGKTGTPTARTAGSAFNVTVNAVDANWNLVTTTDTVRLTSTDGYATLPADTALVAGTKQLSVTLKTAASQTLTASDQTNGAITSNTSPSVTVNAGTLTKLQILLPGETADPGSSTGKTGTPTARTAGTAFNVTVNAVDANWNLVTTTDTVRLTSSDGYATLPADTALVAGTKQLSITLKTAAGQTLTASDQTNGAITSNTSPSVTVNAGSLTKLQLLLPGETADPGSATGKTGTPTARTAGSAFNVTVNAVDANWNLVATTDTVHLTSTDGYASLPADTALVAGTKQLSVTLKTAASQTLTASDQTNGAITSNTSPSVTVNAGTLTKLQILLPGETADPGSSTGKTGTPTARTAGSAFNVTVNAVDANWNLVTTTDTVRLTSTDGYATLPADTALVAGTKQLSVTLKTAASQTLTASDQTNGAITSNTSPSVTVNAGTLTKLQLLLPGETADPGSSTGKTGTPTARTAGTAFNVTVNAVDANWNLVTTTDTVQLTSTDPYAALPANTALVGGTKQLSVTAKTAGSWTIAATDQTNGAITSNTSPSVTVNAGSFTKLQILLPGETAEPGSASGKTGNPDQQTAGAAFTVTVNAVDANWNPVSSTDTVHLTSSDGYATLPADTALVAGTKQLSVTSKTAGSWTFTTSDQSNGAITSNTSPSVTVNAGSFTKLQLLLPGETADPGSSTGKTGSPTARTAGTAFNVTVNAVDANWNLVSTTDTVHLASTDGYATLPADTALVAGTKQLSVTSKTAGSWTFTASDQTNGAITSSTSPSVTVNAGALTKLQILLPGESADPGSSTGKTGTPDSHTAGTAFDVTVNAVDANWNLVTSTDLVRLTSTDGHATLPADIALVAGTKQLSVTLKTAAGHTVTASDLTNGAITSNTSASVTVSAGAFTKLQILLPGENADPGSAGGKTGSPDQQTAASAFDVTVNAVDANWNPVSSTDTVHLTSTDAYATLPADAALVAGTIQLSVTLKTAAGQTLTASDQTNGAISSNTSTSVTVNAGSVAKLQLLLPGEIADPGSTTGKTGSPTARIAGTSFNVTVNAVDANWNLVNTVTHTVHLTSTDAYATLPADTALIGGTKQLAVTFKTAASQTLTAGDLTNGAVSSSTSPSVTVNAGAFSKVQVLLPGEAAEPGSSTGKTGSPDQKTAGSPFDVTVNAVDANWNPVSSTDTVHLTSSDAYATLPADTALVAGTKQLSVTLKTAAAGQTVSASDQSNGAITSNTSASVSVNAASFAKLQLLLPGETAEAGSTTGKTGLPTARTAGAAFTVTVNAVDAYWNPVTSTDTVHLTSSDTHASLPADAALVAGTKELTVTLKTAAAQTLTASDQSNGAITSNTSPSVTVNAGTFTKLQLLLPGETADAGSSTGKAGSPDQQTAGIAFDVTVNAVDANWNPVSSTDTVHLTSSDGHTTLPADTALVAGTKQLSVTLKTAASQTLTVSDQTNGAITSNTSPSVTVNAGAFTKLQLLLPGETADPGSTTGKTGNPDQQTAGNAFDVTVNAVDANWNPVTSTDTVHLTSSDGHTTLPADTALVAGTKQLSVTLKTATSQTLTASDQTNGAITSNTSSSVTVNAGSLTKLQLLLPGETADPGSATGKTGSPTARTAGTAFNVTVNAVDANWNLVSSTDTVHVASTDGYSSLPADTALVAGTKQLSVTLKTAASQTLTASDQTNGTITSNTSPSVTVNAGSLTKLQLLLPGETADPGSSTGKTGTPTARTAGSAFNVTVNAVDANWNLVSTTTHTVRLTSSDSAATLPANTALVGGTKQLSVTLKTAGSQTLTASDQTDGAVTSSQSANVTVNSSYATKLVVTGSASQTAGQNQTITITAKDEFGNTATGYTGNHDITFSGANDSGSGSHPTVTDKDGNAVTLGTATPISFSSGVANTTGRSLVLYKAETAHIVATAGDGGIDNSTTITTSGSDRLTVVVSATAASKLRITSVNDGSPVTATVGFSVDVQSEDVYDNPSAPSQTTTVTLTSKSGCTCTGSLGGTTSGNLTTSSATKTIAGVTWDTAESGVMLTASATSGDTLAAADSTAFTVTAVPTVLDVTTITPSTPIAAPSTFAVTITAEDSGDNIGNVSVDTAVTLSLASGSGTLGGTVSDTILAGHSSVTISGVTYTKAESGVTITATRTSGDNLAPATSDTFTVHAGPATHFTVDASSPQTAGQAFDLTVTALDANGNRASDYSGQIQLTTTDPDVALPPYTFTTSGGSPDNGMHVFSIALTTAGARTVTATDTDDNSITGISSAITVDPDVVDHFEISSALIEGEAGAANQLTIVAADAFGNEANYSGDKSLTFSGANPATSPVTAPTVTDKDGNAAAFGTPTSITFANGVSTAGGVMTLYKAERAFIGVTDGSISEDTTIAVTVSEAALSKFAVSIGTQTNNVPFAGANTIIAQDAFGNTATTFDASADPVALAVSPNGAVAPTTLHGADFTDGVADLTALGVTYTGAVGAHTLTATAATGETGTSADFAVNPGAVDHFSVTAAGGGSIATETAGAAFNVKVTALDVSDNVATTFNGAGNSVDITSNRTCSSGCATTGSFTNGVLSSHSVTLTQTGSGSTLTATRTSGGTQTGTSNSFTVDPSVLTHFRVSAAGGGSIGTQTAGAAFSVKITAQDAYDNTQTSFTGTVDVTSNRTFGAGSGTTAHFTNGVLAGHSITLTLTGSNSTVTAVNTGSTETGTSNAFTVDAAAIDHFAFSLAGAQRSGYVFTGTNTLTAQDQFDNTVTAFNPALDSVTITPNSPLSGTVSGLHGAGNQLVAGDFVGGVADLTALGMTYTGTATTGTFHAVSGLSNKTGDSGDVSVDAGDATHFGVSFSGTQTAGSAFDVTVTALDVSANVADAYTGEIHFTSTDGQAGLPVDYTFDSGDSGVHIFSLTLKTAPSQTVTATDTSNGTITGTSAPITIVPAALDHFLVTNASGNDIATQTAGTSFNAKITAQDAYANTQTSFTGTVSVSSNRTCSAGCTTTAAFTNGVLAAQSITLTQSGANSTITATRTSSGAQSGTSNSFTVNPATASKLVMTSVPGSDVTAGAPFSVTVDSQDAYGNASSVAGDTVVQLNPSGSGTIGGNTGTISGGTSSKTLAAVTYTKSGSLTLVAHRTSGDSLSDSASSSAISIVADSVDHFSVQSASGGNIGTQVAGIGFAVKLTAQDQFDNTATTFGGTVDVTSNRTCSAGCTTTASFTNGVLTGHSVTLTQAGSGSTITATGSGKTGTSNGFTVDAAAANHYGVSASTPQTAGIAFAVTVTALDAFENVAPSHTGTIHFTSSDGQAVVPGNYTFVPGDHGVHAFSATLKTAGPQTVIATNTSSGSINGTSNSISITSASAAKFVVSGSNLQAAGSAQQVTITAKDAFGNTATGYSGDKSITFSGASPSPNGTQPTVTDKTGSTVAFGTATTIAFTGGVSSGGGSMRLYKGETASIVATDVSITTTGGKRLTVTIGVGDASPASSTIVADATSLTADGSSTSLLTVQLDDAYGNSVNSSGGAVTISTNKGTIGSSCTTDCATIDEDDGTYTTTFRSGSVPGTATLTAKLDGSAFTNSGTILLISTNLSLSTSTITADQTSITANGSSTSTITVQLKDVLGNDLTVTQGTVTLATTRGALSAVTDNDDGTYTATLTSPTSAGTATITGKLNGADFGQTAGVDFTAGPATKYIVTVANSSPVAGSAATVTAQRADTNNNPVSTSGLSVAWTKTGSGGSFSSPTSATNANGVASVTFNTATTAGTSYTVTADGGGGVQGTSASFTSIVGAVSTATSTITPSVASIVANGSSTSTITVQLKDSNGNNLTTGGGTVALATTRGTLGSVTNNGNGTYTATLTAGLSAGTAHITGTLNGAALTHTADVTLTAGTAAKFLVTPSSLTPVAGSNVTITAQLADVNGNSVSATGQTTTWSKSCGGGSFSSGTSLTNGSGVASVTFTTPATAGSCTVTATAGGSTGTSAALISTSGNASTATSTITASPTTITANGSSTSTITVRLKDSNGNNLVSSGGTVVITKQSGAGTLGGTTNNANGTYTTTLTAPATLGSATIGATVNSATITTGNATVSYVAGAATRYAVSSGSYSPQAGSAVTISAQLLDASNNPVAASGRTVTWSTTNGGSFSSATTTTNSSGLATVAFTASTLAGVSHAVTASDGSVSGTAAAISTTTAGLSMESSTLTCGPSSLSADASSISICTLQLKDAFGNHITSSGGTATMSATVGSLSDITDNGDGSYTAFLTAPTTVGTALVSARLNGSLVVPTASVTFTGTPPSLVSSNPANDSVGAGRNAVTLTADKSATWTDMSLLRPDGSSVSLPDGSGITYTATADANAAGDFIIRATMTAQGLSTTSAIRFTVLAPPSLVSALPAEGSTLASVSQIALTANRSVTWRDLTVTKDGGTPTPLAGGTGVSIVRDFATTTAGAYAIQVTMDDGITAPVTVASHFTVPSSTPPPDPSPTKLALSITSPSTFKPKTSSVFTIRATATMAATVRGDLYSPKNLQLKAWHFKVKAGTSVVKLKWPSKIRSKGVYKLVLVAQSKGQVTKKTVKVRLL